MQFNKFLIATAVLSAQAEESFHIHFDRKNFLTSLEIMGKGMGSIFAVILILTLIVLLLAKVSGGKKTDHDDED